jgi:hypothetical protein
MLVGCILIFLMDKATAQYVRSSLTRMLSQNGVVVPFHERPIKSAMLETIKRITSRGWEGFIVGGTIRDLVLSPGQALPRDIDIVVCGASLSDLAVLYSDLITRRTRFGGLHLTRRVYLDHSQRVFYDLVFDVWPLEETWAIRQFCLPVIISSLTNTAFLNLDAIAAEIATVRGRPRAVSDHGFFDGIKRRELEINFAPNPFPEVCIARSLLMAAKLRFSIGRDLAGFICKEFRHLGVDALMSAQISHYGSARCSAEELLTWIRSIEQQFKAGASKIMLPVSTPRQRELWSDWPDASMRNARGEPHEVLA